MTADLPLYFDEFESIFNDCGSASHANSILAGHTVQIERGLAVYKQCSNVVPSEVSGELKLAGSPTGYDGAVGDHGSAIAAISKSLNLQEAQSLLLLQRWIRSTQTQVSHGWVPSDAQVASLRRSYASQRWHHLLCMRFVAEHCAAELAAGDVSVNNGNSHTSDAVPVSVDSMLSGLLAAVGDAMEDRTAAQLLIDDTPTRIKGIGADAAISHGDRDSSEQAMSELCLMLHIVLCLLSYTAFDLRSVLESVKRINTGIAHNGLSAWHDCAGVRGLVPRYAVAIIMYLLQCRRTVEALESPEASQGSDGSDVGALTEVARQLLQGPMPPALAPCMLACAAQLLASSSAVDAQLCSDLVLLAEASGPLHAINTLLEHNMLDTEYPGVFADSMFQAVGIWCHVFSLRPSTMEQDVLHQFLDMLCTLIHKSEGLAMEVWSGRPGAKFVMEVIQDASSIFPVFPVAYATLLASLCTDRDSRDCTWQALQELRSFTAYIGEDTQQALQISRSTVMIRDLGCEALQRVLLQGAPLTEPGHIVPMPQISEKLNVGNGCLVRWSLRGAERPGLGLALMIEEIMDRAAKLQSLLLQHEDVTVLEHVVHTLAACSSLLARLLHHDPWRILDLLHRRVAGSNVAGHALCSAAYSTLSVIGSSSSALLAQARGHAVLLGLAVATAGHCMDILTNVSLLLPAAISQMLVAECNGELDLPVAGPIWLITVLEGVHQLETACGKYPAAVAGIKLVESLIKCIGLTDELLTIAMQVISGMGCYHTQWRRMDSSQSWDMTAAVFSVLHCALGCSSLQGCYDAHTTNHDRLLRSLLHDGLLIRLFWANIPEPNAARQAAELFSPLPDKQTHVAGLCMQCVIRAVDVALSNDRVLVPALFHFLFSEQGSGWCVAATINSYARDIHALGDTLHDVPLRFISSLMLLVGRARDVDAETFSAPSFVSLMNSPQRGCTPGRDGTIMLREVLVAPLVLGRCLEDRVTAEATAVAIKACMRDHPSCTQLLLDPHQLSPDCKESGDFVKPDSLLDVSWASLQGMAKPGFFTAHTEGVACVLPIVQVISTIIGSGGSAGTILTSQTRFWECLEAVWLAVVSEATGSAAETCVRAAACIIDIVTCALHQHWHQRSQCSVVAGQLSIIGAEFEGAIENPDGDSAIVAPSTVMPIALMHIFESICSGANHTESCLHDCLESLGAQKVQERLDQGKRDLITAAQAAALLVLFHGFVHQRKIVRSIVTLVIQVQVSTFLGSTIPAELDPHALPLWRELTAHLADLHSLHDTLTQAELNTIKGNLLQSLLGMEVLPAEIHGGDSEMHGVECLQNSCCHLPILARLHDPTLDGPDSCLVDPSRWLLLAQDLNMLEQSSDTFYYDACQRIFNMMQQALTATRTAAAVTVLLSSYTQMLTVAVSHAEGVQVSKSFLGNTMQLNLIQQATESWKLCTACSVTDIQRQAIPHGLRHDRRTPPVHQVVSSKAEKNIWLPVQLTAWGKVQIHLNMAQHLVSLANLAIISEQTSATRSAGTAHLRREPSFAQLAGGKTAAMAGSSPDQALCAVLKACKDILPHIGPLRSRINSKDAHVSILTSGTLDESLASFLHMILEAITLRQGAIMSALRSPQQPSGASSGADVYACVLDATHAVCNLALQGSSSDSARAMSVLLSLVFTIGGADQASPQAKSRDVLLAVPFHQVLAAATKSVAQVTGADALRVELLRSDYPAIALALVQQLAISSYVQNVPQSHDTFALLLRFNAALDPQQTQSSTHAIPAPALEESKPQRLTSETDIGPHRFVKLTTPEAVTGAFGPSGAVLTAHQVSTKGPTLRLGGQGTQATERRTSAHQAAIPGYSSSGRRLLCAVMQIQITRVLALLLSIPKPPAPVLVTVLTSQQVQLHRHVQAFCDLFFAEAGGDLWYVLGAHKGLLLLSAPAAVAKLQKALCRVLDTVASLPLEQSAVARLSTAPVDPVEAKLAEEPTTDASEALLGLQHFWFWVCSVCRSGVCSVEAVSMPTWARKSSSKTPRQGSKHVTGSPEYLRGTAASRSYSPNRIQRDSLSPRPLSPPPGQAASRSPSASPVTSLVPHTAFVSGAIPIINDDVENTRHSEQLAIGVYQIARAAVRLLSLLEPQRVATEVETCGSDGWLSLNTALSLQRQCFELSRHLDRNQAAVLEPHHQN